MVDWIASKLAYSFASGHIVDGIVALMLCESMALVLLRRQLRHGLSDSALAATLAAGAALLLALRAALTGAAWSSVATWLLVALLAHIVDLKLRWDRS